MIRVVLFIGAGSFIGGVLRFLLSRFVQNTEVGIFPYGTMAVNLAGCLLIGIFLALSDRGQLLSAEWRLFLTVGLCGGFTTFSTFIADGLLLLKNGNIAPFIIYIGMSVLLGLLATWAGYAAVKAF